MLKAIIFDMDATILDWSGFSLEWPDMARKLLAPVHDFLTGNGHAIPGLDPFTDDLNDRSLRAWEQAREGGLDAPRLVQVMHDTLTDFGLDMTTLDIDEVLSHYSWGQVPGTRLYPDVKPVLETLRAHDLRLGLLTNAFQPMWMRDKELHDLGVLSCFDCRTSAADVGKLKPHPLPFERTLDCLGATPETAVFVGDSLKADIAGALAIGMKAVWRQPDEDVLTDPDGDSPTPDASIETLDDLLPLLDAWYPGWRNGR